MKHSLKLTLTALLICSFATPQVQAMDYARSLFDSNTKKLIWALTAIIITSFATDAHKKLYNLISPDEGSDPKEAESLWGKIPAQVAQATKYDYDRAQQRIIWLNNLRDLNSKQKEEKRILENWTRDYNKHFSSPMPPFLHYLSSFFKEKPEMLQRPSKIQKSQ